MQLLRPGQRILTIPGHGLTVTQGRATLHAGGAGVDWSQWFSHAWVAKGADSKAASLLNLVASQDLSEVGTVTWGAADGWSAFSVDNYFSTGLVPASGWSMMVRYAGASGAQSVISAVVGINGARFGCAAIFNTTGRAYYNGFARIVAAISASGVMAVIPDQGYFDGVADGAAISGWTTTTTEVLPIGARRNGASIDNPHVGSIQAVGIKLSAMSEADVIAATAAMAAL